MSRVALEYTVSVEADEADAADIENKLNDLINSLGDNANVEETGRTELDEDDNEETNTDVTKD